MTRKDTFSSKKKKKHIIVPSHVASVKDHNMFVRYVEENVQYISFHYSEEFCFFFFFRLETAIYSDVMKQLQEDGTLR